MFAIFSVVIALEDVFAAERIPATPLKIDYIRQPSIDQIKVVFSDSFVITNGTDGFELLKGTVEKDMTIKRPRAHLFVLSITDDFDPNTGYHLSYDGSSNNLQVNGEPVPSFSFTRPNHDKNVDARSTAPVVDIFFEVNNSTELDTTYKMGDTYQFPSWIIGNVNAFGCSVSINYFSASILLFLFLSNPLYIHSSRIFMLSISCMAFHADRSITCCKLQLDFISCN